jgi:5-methylcytosine-specific restriction endonuclease McrA
VRKKVLERDGHCCVAPECGIALFTVVHHLDPAALGGAHDLHRLITLCRGCHDLVHEGRLTVKGDAPESLVWGR